MNGWYNVIKFRRGEIVIVETEETCNGDNSW